MSSKEIDIKIYGNLNNELKNEWLELEKIGDLHIF